MDVSDVVLGAVVEGFGGGGVPVEQVGRTHLIRSLSHEEHTTVRVLSNPTAHEILSHGGTDGGGIPRFNGADDVGNGGEGFFLGKQDFGVLRPEMLGDVTGECHVSADCLSVLLEATTEGANRTAKEFGADGSHEGGVNATGKQEGQGWVRMKTTLDGGHHGGLDLVEMVFFGGRRGCEGVKGRTRGMVCLLPDAVEGLLVACDVAWRELLEGMGAGTLDFRGEEETAGGVRDIERTDAHRISACHHTAQIAQFIQDEEDKGVFALEGLGCDGGKVVLLAGLHQIPIQLQEDVAIVHRGRMEAILLGQFPIVVDFSVAEQDDFSECVLFEKRLMTRKGAVHDGQTMEAEGKGGIGLPTRMVGATGL